MHAEGDAFIADTGYDAERIRANAQKLGMKPVIHPHLSRKQPPPMDRILYRLCYRVECFFLVPGARADAPAEVEAGHVGEAADAP